MTRPWPRPALSRGPSGWLFLLLALLLPPGCAPNGGQAAPGTNPERDAVLAALRTAVARDLGRDVEVQVDHLKVQDGWAFVRGVPRSPGGAPLDYAGTDYEAMIEEGLFDDGISALLRQEGEAWNVATYALGATDVPYVAWDEEYGAPAELFGE